MTDDTILTEPTKRCRKCQLTKPITAFSKNRTKKDGLHNWCKVCWLKPKQASTAPAVRRRLPILIPLEPVSITEPESLVRELRPAFVPIAKPAPEPMRIEPSIDIDTEKATREELTEFARRYIVEYLKANGEAADEFFQHWLPHRYPSIGKETVQRAINDLLEATVIKVSRFEVASLERVNFLALV